MSTVPRVDDAAPVGVEGHHRDRGRRRDAGLEADRDAAAAPDRSAAALERPLPVHEHLDPVEHLAERRVLHDGAGRLRAAVAQQVLAAERERVELQLARDHVGVALVGPDELRNAEAAQRAGRRQVRIEGVRIDRHVLDVVRPWRGKARLLRHPRADVGVGPAVPPHLALAGGDPAVLRHAALDPERRGVLGDGEELLLHRERDLHRPAREEREHRDERLELDVELRAEPAAEERRAHADAVLRPAEEPRDLDAHERRALRRGVDGERVLPRLGHRHERLERRVHHLLRAESVLEDAVGRRECAARHRRGAGGSRARRSCSPGP